MDALLTFGLNTLFPSCAFLIFFMLRERRQSKSQLLLPFIHGIVAALLYQLLVEIFKTGAFGSFSIFFLFLGWILLISAAPGTFVYLILYLTRLYDDRQDYFSDSPTATVNRIVLVVLLAIVLIFVLAFIPFIVLLLEWLF